jgi:hypothetical protein
MLCYLNGGGSAATRRVPNGEAPVPRPTRERDMLTGIHTIDQSTLKSLYHFTIKSGGNIMVFGPAGTGKTEMAQQAAAEAQREAVYLNLSVLEAPDLMGLPMIDQETKLSEYATPKYLPLKGSRGGVVLVVDEIDKAKPELQNPMLEIFQFRSINGRALDIHSVIATGNLPEEGAFSLPVSHALTNRCMVYRVEGSFEPWQKWATEAGVNGLVVGFLSKNSEYLLMPPPEGDDTAYCHPSPRAWTAAARDLDLAVNEPVEFQTMLVAGRVGQAAAVKFRVWLEHYRFIEPLIDKLVDEGAHPDIESMPVDRIMVCAIAGCNRIVQLCRDVHPGEKAKREEKILRVTKNVFGWLGEIPPEFAIGAVKSVLSMKIIQEWKLTRVPELMSTYIKIRKSLND